MPFTETDRLRTEIASRRWFSSWVRRTFSLVRNAVSRWSPTITIVLLITFSGCERARSPLDEPMRYKTTDKLRERLEQVGKYGDGGSSLGGIPESIEELTKSDPEKGKKLLKEFQKLNTANDKETRKQLAKEMANQLK